MSEPAPAAAPRGAPGGRCDPLDRRDGLDPLDRRDRRDRRDPFAVFIVPGPLDTPTGGFRYDRRIIAELDAAGLALRPVVIDGPWPVPRAADLDRVDAVLAALADGTRVVIDGLALGAMPAIALHHRERLRLIGLVHHPLWLEGSGAEEPASAGLIDPGIAAIHDDEVVALGATRRVIVTSRPTARAVERMGIGADRIDVVEPGCDPFPLAPARPDGAPVRLICVASLTPRKGHLDLIEALAMLDAPDRVTGERLAPWTLDLIGATDRDPACRDAVVDRLVEARLTDRVTLVGEVDEGRLAACYAAADGLVSASRYEGYGMSLVEAMMHGLPVVAVRGGGAIAETIGDGGLLVGPGDATALADAIAGALLATPGREALAARARAWRAARLGNGDWASAGRRFAAAVRSA